MSELSYKELQEQGVFDVPYRAFEFMQSQQAKIDGLNKNIEALHVENDRIQKEYQGMFEGVQGRQKTIDELQARIDELKKHSLMLREAANSWNYSEGEKNILISQADDLDRILKGNKDEN